MNTAWRCGVVGLLTGGLFAWGDGFRNPPEGAAALGKAGVSSVYVEDASANSHNAARLAEIEEAQIQASLTFGYSETDYHSPLGDASTEDPLKVLPNVHFAAPLDQAGLVGALSITTPYGQSTEWEDDGVFRYTVPYFAEMALVDVSPAVARTFGRLSVGVGLDVYAATLTLRQHIPLVTALTLPPGVPPPEGRMELEGDAVAVGGHAGLAFALTEQSVIGLSWRSAFDMDFEGDTKLSGMPPPFRSRSDFDTTARFPNIVALGYGVQVAESLRVEAQVEWLEHSRYEELTLDLAENNALLLQPSIPQNWEDTLTYGVGADWTYAAGRVLRAGYSFIESPIPDRTFSPTIPDSDRHVLAVGWGCQAGAGWLDVAYAYSLLDDRSIDDNQNPDFNGDYEFEPHLLAVTYRRGF